MSEVKMVRKYEKDSDEMIEITHDFSRGVVVVRIDDGDYEGVVTQITIPQDIWDKLVF